MLVGERIKSIRVGRGLTVGALADRTGLSKGLISQVENDKTSPSLTTLAKIAEGLGVPPAYLLLKPEEGIEVVRAGERPVYQFGPDHFRVELLTGRTKNLRGTLGELLPGQSTGEGHAHPGEEFHMLLEGRIRAEQGEHSVTLEAGDCWTWKGCVPHRVTNIGEGLARILMVTSTSAPDNFTEDSEMGEL